MLKTTVLSQVFVAKMFATNEVFVTKMFAANEVVGAEGSGELIKKFV